MWTTYLLPIIAPWFSFFCSVLANPEEEPSLVVNKLMQNSVPMLRRRASWTQKRRELDTEWRRRNAYDDDSMAFSSYSETQTVEEPNVLEEPSGLEEELEEPSGWGEELEPNGWGEELEEPNGWGEELQEPVDLGEEMEVPNGLEDMEGEALSKTSTPPASDSTSSSTYVPQSFDGGEILSQIRNGDVTVEKKKYRQGESIKVTFDTGLANPGVSEWRVGIYMHMADPQGGSLPPIVSMKVCGSLDCTNKIVSGTVVFSDDNNGFMEGDWPLDWLEYGTGYDVFLLDETGTERAPPSMFVLQIGEDGEEGEMMGWT